MADNTMKLGLVLSATDRMSRILDGAMGKFNKFNKSIERINKTSNQMFVAGGIAAAGIYKSIQAAEDGAQSERKLANVFRTMWGNNGAANAAGKVASDYAEKLSLLIGVEDDLIRTTQAKLATFSNVSNQIGMTTGIFNRATRAAYDMGAVGFGEASQNAVILGKALQDPLKGINALKKQGTLTANDIISIQNIYKTKGLLKAQEAVLKAVERQVENTSLATAKATDIMRVGFAKVIEEIGGAFLPSVDEARGTVLDFIQPTLDWIKANHSLIRTVAKVAAGMLALAATMRVITFSVSVAKFAIASYRIAALAASKATLFFTGNIRLHSAALKIATLNQWLLNSAIGIGLLPVIAIIAGIAALTVGIIYAWKHFAKFRAVIKTTWETVKGFGNILKEYVIDRIKGILSGLGSIGKAIGLLFQGKFKAAFNEAKVGVKALSGYDARLKAVTKTKALATSISGKYTTILKQEQTAQSPKSSQAVSSVQSSISNRSNSSSIHYNPVVHVGSGSAADKEAFRKQLDDNMNAFEQMMNRVYAKNKRLAY